MSVVVARTIGVRQQSAGCWAEWWCGPARRKKRRNDRTKAPAGGRNGAAMEQQEEEEDICRLATQQASAAPASSAHQLLTFGGRTGAGTRRRAGGRSSSALGLGATVAAASGKGGRCSSSSGGVRRRQQDRSIKVIDHQHIHISPLSAWRVVRGYLSLNKPGSQLTAGFLRCRQIVSRKPISFKSAQAVSANARPSPHFPYSLDPPPASGSCLQR